MRALSPRRHRTTLPETLAGSSVLSLHSSAAAVVAPARLAVAASTSGVAGSALLTDAPLIEKLSLAPVTVTVETNCRCSVLAATVVSHGTEPGDPTVLAP